jgi:hypothetical protein
VRLPAHIGAARADEEGQRWTASSARSFKSAGWDSDDRKPFEDIWELLDGMCFCLTPTVNLEMVANFLRRVRQKES